VAKHTLRGLLLSHDNISVIMDRVLRWKDKYNDQQVIVCTSAEVFYNISEYDEYRTIHSTGGSNHGTNVLTVPGDILTTMALRGELDEGVSIYPFDDFVYRVRYVLDNTGSSYLQDHPHTQIDMAYIFCALLNDISTNRSHSLF